MLDLAVLAVVGEWDGYAVVRRLREAGLADVGDASVYGTLRRLFQAGARTVLNRPPTAVSPASSAPSGAEPPAESGGVRTGARPQPHGLSGRLWQGGAVPTPPPPS